MLMHPEIDPVILHIYGPLAIRWYGLMYLIGFLGFWWLGRLRARQPGSPMNEQQVGDAMFWGALGVVVGGRLGYTFFYNWPVFIDNPMVLFDFASGGMSFHGGLLGVLLVSFWYARKLGITFFQLTDFIAPMIPVGLGAGRIGNFINGELWGRVTDVPWGMVFRGAGELPRHPSQLYQAFLEGLVMFLVLWFFSKKPRPTASVSGLFLMLYGLFRILVEFVREPDAHLGFVAFGWMTQGQLLSLPMILGGIGLMVWAYRREKS